MRFQVFVFVFLFFFLFSVQSPTHPSSSVTCLSSRILDSGVYVQGSGYRVQESGKLTFEIPPRRAVRGGGLEFRVQGLEFMVQCPVFSVLGSGFRV